MTTLEKWLVGAEGQPRFMFRAYAESDVSAADADGAALESLNA
jgi:hypothetical protein